MKRKEQPSQIKKRPPKPTPTRPKLVGTGVQKGLLKTPVDVSDKTKPTYFDGVPTIDVEMKSHNLPARAAQYFEQEAKRRETGLGLGWHIALLFVPFWLRKPKCRNIRNKNTPQKKKPRQLGRCLPRK